jgi:hypothetical protein
VVFANMYLSFFIYLLTICSNAKLFLSLSATEVLNVHFSIDFIFAAFFPILGLKPERLNLYSLLLTS